MVEPAASIDRAGVRPFSLHTKSRMNTTAAHRDELEKLLEDLHDAARKLDDRLCTIERIMTAENPDWRQQCLPGRNENQRLLVDDK